MKASQSSLLFTSFLAANLLASVSFAWVSTRTITHRGAASSKIIMISEGISSSSSVGGGVGEITLDGKEIRGPITPMANCIFVKVKDTLTATGGGILLPDQSKKRPTEGLVIEAGPGKLHPFTGVRITNPISVGMSVLYGQFDGRPIEYKGDECQVIRDDDVLLAYTGVTMKLDTVIPVRDYVLIEINAKKSEQQLQTKSGVVIAAQVLQDALPCQGRVVKVGEGRMASTGEFTPSPVKVGDLVKFKDYAGNEVVIEGKTYNVVKMVDILCTMKEDETDESTAEEAAAYLDSRVASATDEATTIESESSTGATLSEGGLHL